MSESELDNLEAQTKAIERHFKFKFALIHHPDKGGDAVRFREVEEAKTNLMSSIQVQRSKRRLSGRMSQKDQQLSDAYIVIATRMQQKLFECYAQSVESLWMKTESLSWH